MPTCPRCDAVTGEEDRYCLNCGRPLTEGAVPPPARASTAAVPVVPPRSVDADDVDAPEDATSETELVACPRCGASNAARRRWCGRCGGDLGASRLPAAVPRPRPGPPVARHEEPAAHEGMAPFPAAPPPVAPWRRRGISIAVVGLGAVVGTGLGIAAATGVGPFATTEPVAFDAVAYPDAPRRLSPVTAGSSSTAPGDGSREFGPEKAGDDDLTTAWVPEGETTGALLRHAFVAPVWLSRLEIATGDQHDDATFAASGQVTRVMIDLGARRVDATLAPVQGVQLIQLPEPVLTDEVTWEVEGTAGDGAAISEVRYVGWRADEEDQEAYGRRQ